MRGRSGTIAGLIEAMGRVTVRGEDGDFVVQPLEAHGGVDDKTFGASDAKVWVEEDNVLRVGRHVCFLWSSCQPIDASRRNRQSESRPRMAVARRRPGRPCLRGPSTFEGSPQYYIGKLGKAVRVRVPDCVTTLYRVLCWVGTLCSGAGTT